MVVVIVVLTVVVFIIVDAVLRIVMRKIQESKIAKQRKEALDIGLRLDFADEAKSLKRVEVENPKAKILAVDDEEVVLDSFRKPCRYGIYRFVPGCRYPQGYLLLRGRRREPHR